MDAPAEQQRLETAAERKERIRNEAAVIAQSQAEIAMGIGFEANVLKAWFLELDHDPNTPMPEAKFSLKRS